MNEEIKRIRLLKLWEILQKETDEERSLSTNELLARLRQAGIESVRSTLYRDIKILQKYGYEIFCKRAKQNEYYVVERNFSTPEILVLIDALQAATFITTEKTEELVDKIAKFSGSENGKLLRRNVVEFTTPKTPNKNILYAVSEISQAIVQKKKIFFHYFDYDTSFQRVYRMGKNADKKRGYKVNPLGTVFDNGYYYLFCYDDFFGNISHYRVDRMDAVSMLDEPSSEIANQKRKELSERKRKLFYMFGGEERRVDFCVDKDLWGVMFDKFGNAVTVREVQGRQVLCSAEVYVSPTFIAWCCSFGGKLKITSPNDVVESVKTYLRETYQTYT